jgi:hypothetical protein
MNWSQFWTQAAESLNRCKPRKFIDPQPKIFPESAGLLFFRLLSAQETTRRFLVVEGEEMTGKCEGNHRMLGGYAEFVEENVQPFLSTFSVG